jgi:hypothetical protein
MVKTIMHNTTEAAAVVLVTLPAAPMSEADRLIADEFPGVFTTGTSRLACSQAELDYLTGEGEEMANE